MISRHGETVACWHGTFCGLLCHTCVLLDCPTTTTLHHPTVPCLPSSSFGDTHTSHSSLFPPLSQKHFPIHHYHLLIFSQDRGEENMPQLTNMMTFSCKHAALTHTPRTRANYAWCSVPPYGWEPLLRIGYLLPVLPYRTHTCVLPFMTDAPPLLFA